MRCGLSTWASPLSKRAGFVRKLVRLFGGLAVSQTASARQGSRRRRAIFKPTKPVVTADSPPAPPFPSLSYSFP